MYENGVLVAFLIGLYKFVAALVALNSQKAKNYKKIGVFYSYWTGACSLEAPASKLSFVVFCAYVLMVAPLFSWLSVCSFIFSLGHGLYKRVSLPEKMKEFQFKVENIDLPEGEMRELIASLGDIFGKSSVVESGGQTVLPFNDDQLVLDISSDGYNQTLTISRNERIFEIAHYADDCDDYSSRSVYDYRFEGEMAFAKLRSDSSRSFNDTLEHVLDGVVLESKIREEGMRVGRSEQKVSERVARLKDMVKWNPIENYKIRFFLMSRHVEVFPTSEFRRIVRSELERIKLGRQQIAKAMAEIGFVVQESENGFDAKYPDRSTQDAIDALNISYETLSNSDRFAIKVSEFREVKSHEACLLEYLGEVKKAVKAS